MFRNEALFRCPHYVHSSVDCSLDKAYEYKIAHTKSNSKFIYISLILVAYNL